MKFLQAKPAIQLLIFDLDGTLVDSRQSAGSHRAVFDGSALPPGLYFCNNFRGGIAVGDCVMNGKATAERIAQGPGHGE